MSDTPNSGGEAVPETAPENAADDTVVYGRVIDGLLKSHYGIDPARLDRMSEAARKYALYGRDAAEEPGHSFVGMDGSGSWDTRGDAMCRNFGLDPARVRAYYEDLYAHPETRRLFFESGTEVTYWPPYKVVFQSPDPWPTAVTAAELIPALIAAIRAHMSISEHGALLAALWILHTHALDAFDTSPRLVIRSAHSACGKTRLILILSHLAAKPLQLCAAAPRALVDNLGFSPTLLIDGAAPLLRDPTICTILRNGHQRFAGYLLRSDGKETQSVPVFTPAATAIHGKMPPLLAGRSIELRLEPKKPADEIEPIGNAGRLDNLCRMAARWAGENAPKLRKRQDNGPGVEDNWTPLRIIAVEAGEEWDKRLAELIARSRAETGSPLQLLLADIREILRQRKAGEIVPRGPNGAWLIDRDRIRSSDLARLLAELEGQPWNEWGRTASAITPHGLAIILAEANVRPVNLRFNLRDQIGHQSSIIERGYHHEQLEDAFARYLDEAAASNNAL